MNVTTAPPEELIVFVRYIPSTQQFAFQPIRRRFVASASGELQARDENLPPEQGMLVLGDFLKSALVAGVQKQAAKPTVLALN